MEADFFIEGNGIALGMEVEFFGVEVVACHLDGLLKEAFAQTGPTIDGEDPAHSDPTSWLVLGYQSKIGLDLAYLAILANLAVLALLVLVIKVEGFLISEIHVQIGAGLLYHKDFGAGVENLVELWGGELGEGFDL